MATSPYLNPPSWWKEAPLTAQTDSTSFVRVANALIPYLSAPDQSSVGLFVGADKSGLFPGYVGSAVAPNPTESANDVNIRQKFLSADRAKEALANFAALSGSIPFEQRGAGYKMIQQAIALLANLGRTSATGEQGMSRAEYEQLQSGLDAIVSQAEGDSSLAPYADLAKKFINPTLQGGSLMKTYTSGGQTVYGSASSKLYK